MAEIRAALLRHNYNAAAAARELQCSRGNIIHHLKTKDPALYKTFQEHSRPGNTCPTLEKYTAEQLRTLAVQHGSVAAAAREIGVSDSAYRRHMKARDEPLTEGMNDLHGSMSVFNARVALASTHTSAEILHNTAFKCSKRLLMTLISDLDPDYYSGMKFDPDRQVVTLWELGVF